MHRELENCVVTFWVRSQFFNFLGASRGCADFRDPTAVFRFIFPSYFTSLIFAVIPEVFYRESMLSFLFKSGANECLCGSDPPVFFHDMLPPLFDTMTDIPQ